ncbi:uncharacterized protein [Antennarius striatus]|uniref:uncharacterized protein n=1 Tax=Antennarius striatus TaxID=241820 RepID=UPI0035B2C0DF
MSISEAQRWGYNLMTTARKVVLRSPYKQSHAERTMVDNIPVVVVRASLFLNQNLMMVIVDLTMACTVNPGSFDGVRLLWDLPQVMTPLVGEGTGFESQSFELGVEGLLLDKPTATARGFSVVQEGHLIQIGVPFGAEGGHKKSLVVNNMYKEMYVIFLMFEHVFSTLYDDGSSVETRHRMLNILKTSPLQRQPFSLDQTVSDDQIFCVYLGNIPTDVELEEIHINGKQLMSESTKWDAIVSPVVHNNGSRAYKLRIPFEDDTVHWTHLGEGVVEYSIDVNFTLTIVPQRDSYFHHTFITAKVFNAFPPEVTAQCSDKGITFWVVSPPRAQALWEVAVDDEPLTSKLATQRGYRLQSDGNKTTLEVPAFSVGYEYEDINLSNFYGTFKLLLRDSKTLAVQTSSSKRCLFKTQDMIVQPETTTTLDRTCGPKQMDGSRVLFEFRVDSCGTRAMVGN